MTTEPDELAALRRRIQEMHDEELITLLRGAIVSLEELADRLESKLNEGNEGPSGVAG